MELLDVVDENNNLTGKVQDRDFIHANGLWYRAAVIIIINSENKLLLQKRANCVKRYPNRWALTSGHVSCGESEIAAALRETQEELGIKNLKEEDFDLLCVKKIMRKNGNHFKNIFLLKTDLKEDEFILQKDEVSKVKYFLIDEIKKVCENKDKYENEFQPTFFDTYFLEILEKLEKEEK